MIDIVIISVPGIVRKLPQAAPALLKASVEAAGFSCKTIDFNIRFYQENVDIDAIETFFSTGLNLEHQPEAQCLVENWTRDLLKLNPKYVGISVFTYQNRIASELFCESLRKLAPDVKIVLGGQGLSDGGIEGASSFGQTLVGKNLADFWIRSEGEISLVELLKNNTSYPGINSDSFKQIEDLDSLPFPNYDDYEMDLYESKSLPITGSRGCVRSCSFCDIHEHWKYRYRLGKSIANELLYLNKRYDVNHFSFSDSLINGNLREFNQFTKILADYNDTLSEKISWHSQFIVRSPRQVNEEYWKNIARSGGTNLAIGVETGSDKVRHHMNKKFTNEDLDYTMEMLSKYNITCQFLMIVGYPSETEQDFQETLDMFAKYKHLAPDIIVNVNIGSTLGILPGTPLYKDADHLNIEIDKYETNWVAYDNPTLTLENRIARRARLKNYLDEIGYSLKRDSAEHMMKILDDNKEMFKKRLDIKKMIRIKNANQ